MVSRDGTTDEIRTDGGISGVDDQEIVKRWSIFVVGIFAVYSIGNVVEALLLTEVLEPSFSGMGGTSWTTGLIPLGIGVGAALASDRPDELLYKALGVAVAVGMLVMAIVETTLHTELILDNGSLDFAALLKWAIGEIASALVIVVGAVWVTRNHAPDELRR